LKRTNYIKKIISKDQLRVVEERFSTIIHAEPSLKFFDVEVRITRKNEKSAFPDKEEMLVGWKEIGAFLQLHPIWCIQRYGKIFKRDGQA